MIYFFTNQCSYVVKLKILKKLLFKECSIVHTGIIIDFEYDIYPL